MLKMVETNIQTSIAEIGLQKSIFTTGGVSVGAGDSGETGGGGFGDFRKSLGIAYDVDVRNEVQTIRESQARQEKMFSLILQALPEMLRKLRSVNVKVDHGASAVGVGQGGSGGGRGESGGGGQKYAVDRKTSRRSRREPRGQLSPSQVPWDVTRNRAI
jgi:hypothetical protein